MVSTGNRQVWLDGYSWGITNVGNTDMQYETDHLNKSDIEKLAHTLMLLSCIQNKILKKIYNKNPQCNVTLPKYCQHGKKKEGLRTMQKKHCLHGTEGKSLTK